MVDIGAWATGDAGDQINKLKYFIFINNHRLDAKRYLEKCPKTLPKGKQWFPNQSAEPPASLLESAETKPFSLRFAETKTF